MSDYQHMIHDCQYEAMMNFEQTLAMCGRHSVAMRPSTVKEPRPKCPECLALIGTEHTCPNCGETGHV